MNKLKGLAIGSAVSAVALFGAPAMAGSTEYGLGVASDYIFRGLPSSGNGAQVWGSIDWSSKSGLYAGTWLSNAALAGGEELDIYGGYTFGGKDLSFDVGAIAYLAPSAPEGSVGQNQSEAYGGVTSGPFSGYVYYNFGNNGVADDERVYVDLNVEIGKITIHGGYTLGVGDAFDNLREDDYIDLGVTCVTDLGKAGEITWAVTWTNIDTDAAAGTRDDVFNGGASADRPQFTVGWSNSWGG